MPQDRADWDAFAAVGVERFAVSLTAPDVDGLHTQLAEMAKKFLTAS
jgi:hypothetical protein